MSGPRLTRAQARELDRIVIDEFAVPGIVLMEHAGRSVAEAILAAESSADPHAPRTCAVFCGGGNNGGDGFVIARWLDDAGWRVACWCTAGADATRGDARLAREACARARVPIHELGDDAAFESARATLRARPPRLCVDALLGTGFEARDGDAAAVRPDVARAIRLVNELGAQGGARVWAVDLPSGLDADAGIAAEPTVRADVTATFIAEKAGFARARARAVLGRVLVLPIGAPRAAIERVLAASAPGSADRAS